MSAEEKVPEQGIELQGEACDYAPNKKADDINVDELGKDFQGDYHGKRLDVSIEYCSSCGYRAKVSRLEKQLHAAFPNRLNIESKAGRSKSYEVVVDGATVHSKLGGAGFPKNKDIGAVVAEKVAAMPKSNDAPVVINISNEALGLKAANGNGAAADADHHNNKHEGKKGSPLLTLGRPTAEEREDFRKAKVQSAKGKGQENENKEGCYPFWFMWPLFWYPYHVNAVDARLTGIQGFTIALLSIIFREERNMWYVVVFLFGDYMCRIVFGGRMTLLGANASMISWMFPVRLTSGPPKQFAAMCGAMFTGIGALLFFNAGDGNGVAGAIVMGMYMCAAGLEGFLDFCLGCLFFKYFEKFGIIKSHVSEKVEEQYSDREKTVELMDTRLEEGATPSIKLQLPDCPVSYKQKTDAQRREAFNIVKHCDVTWFAMPLGVLALSALFQAAWVAKIFAFADNADVWIGVQIVALAMFFSVLSLFLARAILYPRKVLKDWSHPIKANFFSAIPIFIAIWSLMFTHGASGNVCEGCSMRTAKVMWWIAAPLMGLLAIFLTARVLRMPNDEDYLNPGWMMNALGCAVVAKAGYALQIQGESFEEASAMFYSFAVGMWFVLFTMTFRRSVFLEQLDNSVRPSLFVWVAAPAVLSISAGTSVFSAFANIFFYFASGMALVMVFAGAFNMFNRGKFGSSHWVFVFCVNVYALAALEWHLRNSGAIGGSKEGAAAGIVLGTALTMMCTSLTIGLTLKRKLFVSPEKFGPLSWTKLWHYAFREAGAKLVDLSTQLDKPDKARQFYDLLDDFAFAHHEHSQHEEHALFPLFRNLFPGCTGDADDEHDRDHGLLARMSALARELRQADAMKEDDNANQLRAVITKEVVPLMQGLEAHLDTEELDLAFVGRKYAPLALQKQVVRQIFELTPYSAWRRLLPFVVNNNYVHGRRVKFIVALRWAMPERIQHIGALLKNNVPRVVWLRLLSDVPELAPRGTRGYSKVW